MHCFVDIRDGIQPHCAKSATSTPDKIVLFGRSRWRQAPPCISRSSSPCARIVSIIHSTNDNVISPFTHGKQEKLADALTSAEKKDTEVQAWC